MKKLLVLFLMLGTFISSNIIYFNTYAETVSMEFTYSFDELTFPLYIHAGDRLLIDINTNSNNVSYQEYLSVDPIYYDTPDEFYFLLRANDFNLMYTNIHGVEMIEGTWDNFAIVTTPQEDDFVKWYYSDGIGYLEFKFTPTYPLIGYYTSANPTIKDTYFNSTWGNLGDFYLWQDVELNTVSFNTKGGTSIDNQYLLDGETITAPADPIRDGYIFDGWYTNPLYTTEWNFNDTIDNHVTLYAKYIYANPVINTLINILPIISTIVIITGSVLYIKFSSTSIISKLINVMIGSAIGFSLLGILMAFI